MTYIDAGHEPTEVKNIILSNPSITQIMVDSYCEILWAENSGAYLGRHPTENYAAVLDDAANQAVIAKQRLRSKILGLWIKNSLKTNDKRSLRDFKSVYTFNTQDYGAAMLFVIIKMVRPDTRAGCSYIDSKMENMKMSHFKHDIPKYNLHIAE